MPLPVQSKYFLSAQGLTRIWSLEATAHFSGQYRERGSLWVSAVFMVVVVGTSMGDQPSRSLLDESMAFHCDRAVESWDIIYYRECVFMLAYSCVYVDTCLRQVLRSEEDIRYPSAVNSPETVSHQTRS